MFDDAGELLQLWDVEVAPLPPSQAFGIAFGICWDSIWDMLSQKPEHIPKGIAPLNPEHLWDTYVRTHLSAR